MAYIGSQPTKVVSQQSSRVYRYTATAGQTVFSGADVNNQVLNVTPSDVEVHMNGLLLEPTDYTVTSSSVTLGTAANAGDELTITGMVTFEVADTYDKTTADARYVNAAGDTMTGTLSFAGVARNTDGVLIGASNAATGYGLRIGASGATDPLEIWREHSNGNQMQLSVDYFGRVTMPYQPRFHATRTAGHGTTGKIIFNNVDVNVGNHYNNSTGVFTAPISGDYLITTTVLSNNGTTLGIDLKKNGNRYAVTEDSFSGTSYRSSSVTTIIPLSANDTVEVHNKQGGYYGTNRYTFFAGHLIG